MLGQAPLPLGIPDYFVLCTNVDAVRTDGLTLLVFWAWRSFHLARYLAHVRGKPSFVVGIPEDNQRKFAFLLVTRGVALLL